MDRQNPWDLVEHYLGPIRKLFDTDGVTEICVNRHDEIWIEKYGEFQRVEGMAFPNEDYVATMVNQIANALGQAVNKDTHPILDARLKDGTRVCAPLHPVSVKGTSISFRIFPKTKLTAKDLIKYGSFTEEMLEYLRLAIICHYNILVSGGTGSGKTTLLNIISEFIPLEDRVITVEDTQELKITTPNIVNLEAPTRRQQTGAQRVDMALLIKTCLRMNPTRIVVGEIRDASAATAFLHAINTGHTSCSTIHANSSIDALERIQTLVAGHGDLPFQVVKSQVRSNLNLIIHAEKTPHHGRKLTSIAEVQSGEVIPIYRWSYSQAKHVKTDSKVELYERLEKYGEGMRN
jgi:pilus assembly protein CpaF